MTQKDKDLLLKDLSGRLPYGVICKTCVGNYKLIGIDETTIHVDSPVYDEGDGYFDMDYMEVKPYLRPMSSMTEGERKELIEPQIEMELKALADDRDDTRYEPSMKGRTYCMDYLNSHHFDYRGLIPEGLAIKVTENNNPYGNS